MAREDRPVRSSLALLIVLGSGVAHADFYKCTTADGRTVSGDLPPPECMTREYRRYGNDGRLLEVIAAPLTPEQKRQRAEEEKRKAEEEEAKRDQSRRDRSLLETYGTIEEIEATRKRAAADRQILIDRAQKRLDELKRERKRLDDETEFYVKRQLPEKLKRALADNNEAVKGQQKVIADAKAEARRADEFYGAQAKRYQELMDLGAQPIQRLTEKK